MQTNDTIRPYVLTIAGYDGSSGAGLTADIKTMEQIGVYGLSVCTAITVQHESVFKTVKWIDIDLIKQQIILLIRKYPIDFCKIGLVENEQILQTIIHLLTDNCPDVKIVLDPVFSASAGFNFDYNLGYNDYQNILNKIYLLTPNAHELGQIGEDSKDLMLTAKKLMQYCNVLYKGGHNENQKGTDILFEGSNIHILEPKEQIYYEKHGSGCVLSAALVSYLALGCELLDASKSAKDYISSFLISNDRLLGYHFLK